jgi:hypothetical protein
MGVIALICITLHAENSSKARIPDHPFVQSHLSKFQNQLTPLRDTTFIAPVGFSKKHQFAYLDKGYCSESGDLFYVNLVLVDLLNDTHVNHEFNELTYSEPQIKNILTSSKIVDHDSDSHFYSFPAFQFNGKGVAIASGIVPLFLQG